MTADHQFKKHFRKDYGSADYRRVYDGLLDEIATIEDERDAVKRRMAFHWRRIEASRHGAPECKLGFWEYAKAKDQHLTCEQKIAKLESLVRIKTGIWDALEPPTKPRVRRTVLVDGFRTKIEREYA